MMGIRAKKASIMMKTNSITMPIVRMETVFTFFQAHILPPELIAIYVNH
jgi:hypothetical protein